MRIKKIASIVMSAVIAAGVCTGVPIGSENNLPLAITAEAADSDFVIKTNDEGKKCLTKYKGKGGDVVIPKEVEVIDPEVFAENSKINSKITSVTFKGSCVWVSPYAFSECLNLKKVVFEGDAAIAKGAFYYSYNLESVTIKGSIKDGIYLLAFYGCQNLKTVKICKNENEFEIGGSAFRDCYSLTSINIPSKCTDISGCAFLNCFSLEKLTVPANTKINEEGNGECHFGYASLYKSSEDFNVNDYISGGVDVDEKIFVADGKTSGYAPFLGDTGYRIGYYTTDLCIDVKEFTPQKLTLTVTKGSQAEKWAKKNKVAYVYEDSSSES